ncbi:MAG: ECF transporter S component [Lachnospiraceae bacterium]|nr:ECF transporter S component [Lachnospiraceae bacterium]
MESKAKKLTVIAMFAAMAYIMAMIGRVPIVLFLKYDPKDIIITLGGFLWGPLTACAVSVMVSLLQMFTTSSTGAWGCVMNIISTCAFACVAALIYKKKSTLAGAVIGLLAGIVTMTSVMLFWNYLIAPVYMGYPREEIVKLLVPAFLPFNLIKGGLNAVFTIILYKPVIKALRKAGYASPSEKV